MSIANGRVVTLVGQEERDFAVAWDAATGRELWRVELGATHPDQFGGPASTPALDGTRAFVLGSSCLVRALDAATGRELWALDLKARFQARRARAACRRRSCTRGARSIVQTAAVAPEQPRVVAVDPATGEPAWQTKFAERAPYTSPLAATLAGVPQILVHHAMAGPPPLGGLTALDPGNRQRSCGARRRPRRRRSPSRAARAGRRPGGAADAGTTSRRSR